MALGRTAVSMTARGPPPSHPPPASLRVSDMFSEHGAALADVHGVDGGSCSLVVTPHCSGGRHTDFGVMPPTSVWLHVVVCSLVYALIEM